MSITKRLEEKAIIQGALKAGADPNSIGQKHKTPLDWDLWNDSKEMITVLQKHGAQKSTEQ